MTRTRSMDTCDEAITRAEVIITYLRDLEEVYWDLPSDICRALEEHDEFMQQRAVLLGMVS